MEALRGSLFSIVPGVMRAEGYDLAILDTLTGPDRRIYVDVGYRRRIRIHGELYLIHWEPDGTARWERMETEDELETDSRGRRVLKLASWLRARGYKCACFNGCSMNEYYNSCAYAGNVLLTRNGSLEKESGWFDYNGYKWYVRFHRPGLLTVGGRDVEMIFPGFWLTCDLMGDRETENAFARLFEGRTEFTNEGFVRWLEGLGMGDVLCWIKVVFFDDPKPVSAGDLARVHQRVNKE